MTRVSAITPVLNAGHTVERAIRSVLEQDYPDLEYIVIDGGSTDGTLDVVRRYESRLASWTSEPDRGIADAFNKGVSRATGELIVILNADDQHQPRAIRTMVDAYRRDPAPCILHGDKILVDARGGRRVRPHLRRWWLYYDMPLFHTTCFVHRDVYEQVGLFDTSYRFAMDFDFIVRAWRAGIEMRYVPEVITTFAAGGTAMRNTRHALREVLRSQRAHGMNPLVCRLAFAGKMTAYTIKTWFNPGTPAP